MTRGSRGDGGAIRRTVPADRASVSRGHASANAAGQRQAVIERRATRETARSEARAEVRGDRSTAATRSYDRDAGRGLVERNPGTAQRYDDRNAARGGTGADRGRYESDRGRSGRDGAWNRDSGRSRGGAYDRSHGGRQGYERHGRVSRVHRHGGGYRVWIAGAPYPFYVPLAHFRHDLFRVGLMINLGGWYNPLGYYEYDPYYRYGSRDRNSDGWMRGTVESVDYRSDTFVVRNDATGNFVTVYARDRRMDVRPGDYVDLTGEWTRSGLFRAWDIDLVDYGYRR